MTAVRGEAEVVRAVLATLIGVVAEDDACLTVLSYDPSARSVTLALSAVGDSPDALLIWEFLAESLCRHGIRLDTVRIDTVRIDAIPIDAIPIDAIPIDTVPVDTVRIDAVPVETVRMTRRSGSRRRMAGCRDWRRAQRCVRVVGCVPRCTSSRAERPRCWPWPPPTTSAAWPIPN